MKTPQLYPHPNHPPAWGTALFGANASLEGVPHTLFISDLHLCATRPQVTQLFFDFLTQHAPQADALYILGDLFEYWAGDDDLEQDFHRRITAALAALKTHHTSVFMVRGNRDFLMGEKLANACQAKLLADPSLIDLYGTPTLVTHGDALCTDDVGYQTFRQQVRSGQWQADFLAQPLTVRRAQIEQLRSLSEREKQHKAMDIMDVNAQAVSALLREHGYPRLIHGHTHRLATHQHFVDGVTCERWVLGDWHDTGNALCCAASGCGWIQQYQASSRAAAQKNSG